MSSFWACREKGWPRVPDAVRCSRENRRTPIFTYPGKESKQKKWDRRRFYRQSYWPKRPYNRTICFSENRRKLRLKPNNKTESSSDSKCNTAIGTRQEGLLGRRPMPTASPWPCRTEGAQAQAPSLTSGPRKSQLDPAHLPGQWGLDAEWPEISSSSSGY